jgi:hypothetical protein
MRLLFQKFKYPIFILLVAVLGYFWFLIFAPIYDFADEFFPGRYFMLESIRNGIFPLWIPYQSMGLPVHADPQAGTFYLPLWILSLFTDYNPYCWGIEYIFHAFFGGLGFFFLSKHFTNQKNVQFIIAVAYMLSGFFVGNVQHIAWIIAATWIPWIIYWTIHFYQNPSLKASLFIAIFASLLFNGGYPGFWILTAYLFLAISIYFAIKNRKKITKRFVLKTGGLLLLTAVITIILTLPALISFVEIKGLMTRGVPLSYDSQISCSYSPKSFLSLFFPFIACTEGNFIKNDISMSSIYIGILLLPFIFAGLLKKKDHLTSFFIGIGIIALLLAVGKYLPFHRWAFNYIPLINMMRLPSIFRLFIIIPLLIVAIHGLNHYAQKLKIIKIVMFLLGGAILFFISILYVKNQIQFWQELKTTTWNNILDKPIYFKFIIQGIIQLFCLGLAVVWIYFKPNQIKWFAFVLLVDLIGNGAFCIHKTGYIKELTNSELNSFLNKMPENYVIPKEIITSNQIYWKTPYPYLWRNLGIFSKQVEWFSYKGVILKNFEIMTTPNIRKGEELYFPKVAFSPKLVQYSETALEISPDTAYSDKMSLAKKYLDSTSTLDLCEFEPGNIIVKTNFRIERPLVVCQSYYPGWKAKTENGKPLKINPMNTSMLSVMVPKGEHQIHFYYHRPDIIWGFACQLLGTLSVLLTLLFLKRKHTRIA